MNNKYKRVLSIILVCIMMVSVLPLVPEAQISASRKGKAKNRVTIINIDPLESTYRKANAIDFKEVFDSGKFFTSYYYSFKSEERLKAVKASIKDGVDFLVIVGDVDDSWKKTLKRAKAKGIKIIMFDKKPDISSKYYDALVITDYKKSANVAIKWLEKQNLGSYRILHLQGSEDSLAHKGRSAALKNGIKRNGWEYVASDYLDWSDKLARDFVSDTIKNGYDFNIIFSENDNMALGAMEALDAAGISHGIEGQVKIIGCDSNSWALKYLLEGKWNFEVQCSPYMAKDVLSVINKFRAGKTIKGKTVIIKNRGFDASTITQKQVDEYGF